MTTVIQPHSAEYRTLAKAINGRDRCSKFELTIITSICRCSSAGKPMDAEAADTADGPVSGRSAGPLRCHHASTEHNEFLRFTCWHGPDDLMNPLGIADQDLDHITLIAVQSNRQTAWSSVALR